MSKLLSVEQWLLLFDLHYPEHDPESWECVLDFAARTKIDGVIFGGDALDLSCISHHTVGKSLYRPKGALKSNLDGFVRDILDPLDKRLRRGCKKRWLMGNHEAWLTEQMRETAPELDGMIDLAGYLGLQRRGYQVIQQGGFTRIGKLYVIHGDTVGGGANAAKKAVEVWGHSVVLGHHHTLQQFTRSSPAHDSERWTGTVLPCLSRTAPGYGRGRANTWLNGFGVCSVRPGGAFNLYPVVITRGQCTLPTGETYGKLTGK